MTEAEPESPCVNVCALDPGGQVCVGCGRSLDEIGEWSRAGAGRKHAIVAAAARRLAILQANESSDGNGAA